MISVSADFNQFCANLRMSDNVIESVRRRYHNIKRIINQSYWNNESSELHGMYTGSYGRDTSIYTSDIDIIVELPNSEFDRFNSYVGNGQSALLQSVKRVVASPYSRTSIRGDGQVIVVDFTDGIKFEIVPAFAGTLVDYHYPDTNNGGSWKVMNPKREIRSFNSLNNNTNGNLKLLCRMTRAWKEANNVNITGIVIDTLAYNFLHGYAYRRYSPQYYSYMTRDFFQYIVEQANYRSWSRFGLEMTTNNCQFMSKAQQAYNWAVKAIEAENNRVEYMYRQCWRNVYGTRFPQR
ncbi:SMODS domain-containing nucleotidyltransferase [Phascolarctobacterium sp.]|uniref:SMODS domain-containing nucleotidyltransferase n=1 Tax=Phascolarctobacterium sp. TaxID=2049039 RepID=UPI003863213D